MKEIVNDIIKSDIIPIINIIGLKTHPHDHGNRLNNLRIINMRVISKQGILIFIN